MEKAIKYDYIYNAVDELFKKSWAAEYSVYKRVLNIIANAPTTDVVEVYCKDCKFGDWDSEPDDAMVCMRTKDGFWRSGNDFCSFGERKDNGDC